MNLNEQDLNEKMDRLLLLLEGTANFPGLAARTEHIEQVLNGVNGNGFGIIQKVNFMWRAHVWIIGACGTIIGSVGTYVMTHIK